MPRRRSCIACRNRRRSRRTSRSRRAAPPPCAARSPRHRRGAAARGEEAAPLIWIAAAIGVAVVLIAFALRGRSRLLRERARLRAPSGCDRGRTERAGRAAPSAQHEQQAQAANDQPEPAAEPGSTRPRRRRCNRRRRACGERHARTRRTTPNAQPEQAAAAAQQPAATARPHGEQAGGAPPTQAAAENAPAGCGRARQCRSREDQLHRSRAQRRADRGESGRALAAGFGIRKAHVQRKARAPIGWRKPKSSRRKAAPPIKKAATKTPPPRTKRRPSRTRPTPARSRAWPLASSSSTTAMRRSRPTRARCGCSRHRQASTPRSAVRICSRTTAHARVRRTSTRCSSIRTTPPPRRRSLSSSRRGTPLRLPRAPACRDDACRSSQEGGKAGTGIRVLSLVCDPRSLPKTKFRASRLPDFLLHPPIRRACNARVHAMYTSYPRRSTLIGRPPQRIRRANRRHGGCSVGARADCARAEEIGGEHGFAESVAGAARICGVLRHAAAVRVQRQLLQERGDDLDQRDQGARCSGSRRR